MDWGWSEVEELLLDELSDEAEKLALTTTATLL
jgi:hypothetical protein